MKMKKASVILNQKINLRKNQEFFTPPTIADELIEQSGIQKQLSQPGQMYLSTTILEPSAGRGSLVNAVRRALDKTKAHWTIDMVEYTENNRVFLKSIVIQNKFELEHERDFLLFDNSKEYNYIFMNPPFHLKESDENKYDKDWYDYDFVRRAYAFLAEGGILMAITGKNYLDNP